MIKTATFEALLEDAKPDGEDGFTFTLRERPTVSKTGMRSERSPNSMAISLSTENHTILIS